jgi:hypothetical protein
VDLNPDFAEMLSALLSAKARFLVVGAYAVAHHAEPRFTKDLDIWVEPGRANAARVLAALREFGAPLKQLSIDDLCHDQTVYQLGVEPHRIDILTGIDGVRFRTAWPRRAKWRSGTLTIPVIGLQDLIRSKQATARPQDLLDLQHLTPAKPSKRKKPAPRPSRKRRSS